MANVKPILYKNKTLANGEHPIVIRVSQLKVRKYIYIGYSSNVDNWDDQAGAPKKKHPYYNDVLTILRTRLADASKLQTTDEIENHQSSLNDVVEKLKKVKVGQTTLFTFFESYETELLKQQRIGYSKLFGSVANSLKRYTKVRDPLFIEIDLKFLKGYEEYLKALGKKTTTISSYFRTFRTLYKEAIKRKLCPANHYPFKDFDFSDYNDPETAYRSIDKAELHKIFEIQLDKQTRKYLSQMMFKFSYLASGMNFIDMVLLRWENVKSDRIEYIREKTDKPIVVIISSRIKEILDYYKSINYSNQKGYVFPMLDREYLKTSEDQKARHNRIVGKRGDFNRDISDLAKSVGITENITSYVARHSFAFNLYRNGIEKRSIGQALGHRYEKITNKYIGKLDYQTLADQFDDVL